MRTLGDAWQYCVNTVLETGHWTHDGEIPILECLALSVQVEDPRVNDDFVYSHADPQVLKRMLDSFGDVDPGTNRCYTYAQRFHNLLGIDQVAAAVERLSVNRATKAATCALLLPGECSRPSIPCLCLIDLKIRDESLHLFYYFRSQNIFGRQYANLVALARLQHQIAAKLSAGVGMLSGLVASAHIYEFDVPSAKLLVAGSLDRIVDQYYTYRPNPYRRS